MIRKTNLLLIFVAILSLIFGVRLTEAANIPPLVKNLYAWYDSSNSGSLTLGTAVTAWNDLSGNGYNLVASAGISPTPTANGINGLNTITFNGGALYNATSGFPTSSDYSIFVVAQFSALNGNNLVSAYANTGTSHAFWGNNAETPSLWHGGATFVTGSSAGTSPFLTSATYVTSTGAGSVYLNGNTPATGTTTNKTVTDASLEIGGDSTGHDLSGQIGEILIFPSALNTTNRQKIEGYLACKWGMQTNLPAGHPYKSTCTGVNGAFSPSSVATLQAWYDASNSGSITTASINVTNWSDLSGHGYNLVSSAGLYPTQTANGINGLNTITFNGGVLYNTTSGFPTSSDYSIFVVAQFSALNGNNLVSAYANTGTSHAFWGNNAETPSLWHGATFVTGSSAGTSPFLASATYVTSTGAGSVYLNGNTPATGTTANKTLTDASLEIGGDATGHDLSGQIGEILIYNASLSNAEQQYIEGYLACKWGTQANLPSGHAYKTSCPSGTASFSLSTAVSPTNAQIPGTLLTYTVTYTNNGGLLNYNPVITAPIPAHTMFSLSSATSNQQTTNLSAPTIAYSNNNGSTYAYTPVSGGGGAPSGYDSTVTNIRWTFSGALGCGTVNNVGTVTFAAKIL